MIQTAFCWNCDATVEVAEGRCWECCAVLGRVIDRSEDIGGDPRCHEQATTTARATRELSIPANTSGGPRSVNADANHRNEHGAPRVAGDLTKASQPLTVGVGAAGSDKNGV